MTAVLAVSALLVPVSGAIGQQAGHSFSFPTVLIGSAPGAEVSLTGGGAFGPLSSFVKAGGSFRCLSDVTSGPLAGLRAGEGVRWDAAELLPTSGFKCSGSAAEPLKTAITDDDTAVFQARFFRVGDGNNPSFTAKVFVSAGDEDPLQPGVQNIWIQGVGCGEANVNLR